MEMNRQVQAAHFHLFICYIVGQRIVRHQAYITRP